MRKLCVAGLALAATMGSGLTDAHAGCVTKAAQATAGTADSAKWFALETMVQSVSWGLWPSFLQDGSVPGYKISKQQYKCTPGGDGVTCIGHATFCKTG